MEVRQEIEQVQMDRTYDEPLVEGEHDDELDGEELAERLLPCKLLLRQSVEYKQSVQRHSANPREPSVAHERDITMLLT